MSFFESAVHRFMGSTTMAQCSACWKGFGLADRWWSRLHAVTAVCDNSLIYLHFGSYFSFFFVWVSYLERTLMLVTKHLAISGLLIRLQATSRHTVRDCFRTP